MATGDLVSFTINADRRLEVTFEGDLGGLTEFEGGAVVSLAWDAPTPAGGTAAQFNSDLRIEDATYDGSTNTVVLLYGDFIIHDSDTAIELSMTAGALVKGAVSSAALVTEAASANNSALAYPKAIARWAMVSGLTFGAVFDDICGWQTANGAQIHLEAIADHYYGIASVEFTLDDREHIEDTAGTTITDTATALTLSTWDQDAMVALRMPNGIPVYRGTLDAADLPSGRVLARFRAIPVLGEAASIRDSDTGDYRTTPAVGADGSESDGWASSYPHYNNAGTGGTQITPSYAWISNAGDDTTGAGSTTNATARTTPYENAYTAMQGAATARGTGGSGGDGTGLIVFAEAGSYQAADYAEHTSNRLNTVPGFQYIAADPDADPWACKITTRGPADGMRTHRIAYVGFSFEPSVGNDLLYSNSGNPIGTETLRRVWFKQCRVLHYDNTVTTTWFSGTNAIVYYTGCRSIDHKYGFPGASTMGKTQLSRGNYIEGATADVLTRSRCALANDIASGSGAGGSHADIRQFLADDADANIMDWFTHAPNFFNQPLFTQFQVSNVSINHFSVERAGNTAGGASQLLGLAGDHFIVRHMTQAGRGLTLQSHATNALTHFSIRNSVLQGLSFTDSAGTAPDAALGIGFSDNHIINGSPGIPSFGYDGSGGTDTIFEDSQANGSATQDISWRWLQSDFASGVYTAHGLNQIDIEIVDADAYTVTFTFDSESERDAVAALTFTLTRGSNSVSFTELDLVVASATEVGTTQLRWTGTRTVAEMSQLLDATTSTVNQIDDGTTTHDISSSTAGLGVLSAGGGDYHPPASSDLLDVLTASSQLIITRDNEGNERTTSNNAIGALLEAVASDAPTPVSTTVGVAGNTFVQVWNQNVDEGTYVGTIGGYPLTPTSVVDDTVSGTIDGTVYAGQTVTLNLDAGSVTADDDAEPNEAISGGAVTNDSGARAAGSLGGFRAHFRSRRGI